MRWELAVAALVVLTAACSSDAGAQSANNELTCADYLSGNYVPEPGILRPAEGSAEQRNRIAQCRRNAESAAVTAPTTTTAPAAPRVSIVTVPVTAALDDWEVSQPALVAKCLAEMGLDWDTSNCVSVLDTIERSCSTPDRRLAMADWLFSARSLDAVGAGYDIADIVLACDELAEAQT